MKKPVLNSDHLKLIAIAAMTIDHVTSVVFPGYPTDWYILLMHVIGRIAAPIFWYFIAEGFHYTHDVKKYALRLFAFAIISHFAYNFAFGIPFIPFKTSVFNQTSVIWPLAWGLVALAINKSPRFKPWQRILLILLICAVTFPSDWSCIAVLAILYIGEYRGCFKKQMGFMMLFVAMYAAVYAIFINTAYGIIQLCAALAIPILSLYNGQKGNIKGMKWFFYIYYPVHLVICGVIRLLLNGDIGVMIGG